MSLNHKSPYPTRNPEIEAVNRRVRRIEERLERLDRALTPEEIRCRKVWLRDLTVEDEE